MKISRIGVYRVVLPLAKPYKLSGGRLEFRELDSTLVRIDTDEGVHGWGEGCPWGSTYLPGFARGIRAGMDEIAPQLLGMDPRRLDAVNRRMDTALPGHPYLKSPLDMACWDLLGRSTGLALAELLGGREPEPVALHSSISTGTPEQMLALVMEHHERGYRIHSCKVGADVVRDIERIELLVRECPPGTGLTFDVNRAWLPDQAMQVMNAVSAPGAYYEQPCETLDECIAVRRMTRAPIILDECIQAFGDLLRAQREGACEAIGLKVGRVGGITKARRMRDFCLATGIRMNVEETGASILGDTAAVHLAQSTPASHRRATWLCHDMLTVDVAPGQGARNHGGYTSAPMLPGIGVEPDPAVLGEPVAVYA